MEFVIEMLEKLKLSCDGVVYGNKKYVQGYGEVFLQTALGGSLKSGGRFFVRAFGRNLASVTLKCFYI